MQKEPRRLSRHAFGEAASFLRARARPLEVSRFESVFGGSGTEDVLAELGRFQNSDGGFGRALEPDLRAPESSVLCTSLAFQMMREHQIPGEGEMLRRGICYLMDTLDRSELHWRIIPESAGVAPHAPWWNQDGREEEFRGFSLNPTAEIFGYLLDFGGLAIGEPLALRITDRIVDSLRSLKAVEMHDLLCCLRLLETKNFPPSAGDVVRHELRRLVAGAVALGPEQWEGYSLRPLQVVRHPDSPFMDGLEDAVSRNLDFEIEEQKGNGCWLPTWTWGDPHPEGWATAKREWSGVLTLDKLLVLHRFGRMEIAGGAGGRAIKPASSGNPE